MTQRRALEYLGLFTGLAYGVVGLVGGLWPGRWDETGATDQVLWFVFLLGSGVLVLAGVRLLDRSPTAAGVLISLGAVVGAVAIFWTVVPLLLAVALVTLSVMHARRTR